MQIKRSKFDIKKYWLTITTSSCITNREVPITFFPSLFLIPSTDPISECVSGYTAL